MGERLHKVFGQIGSKLVSMATESAHWLIMGKRCLHLFSVVFDQIFFKLAGNEDRHKISDVFRFRPDQTTPYRVRCPWAGKWCPQTSSFIFDQIFVKLAGNQDRHKISDEFEFLPDRVGHLGVTCPWRRMKFSVDLLWNLQVQLTFQMKIYWVPCGRNSSYSFPPIVLKLFRCFLHGMKICIWYGYNPLIIFSHFFCFVNLVFFVVWNAIKVYRQWLPCGRSSSYSFPPIILKLCRCFLHRMKICMWFEYNTLSIFSHFFCCVNLVSFFFTWNAIKVYRQWVPCGRNSSYSFPPIVLKLHRCFLHEMKMCMWFWYNTCTLIIFSHFFCFVNFRSWNYFKVFFLHEMLSKCIDSDYLSSYSFALIVLKLCRCVLHGMKMCI